MLLPLQFSWAAVAGYCTHEADPQAQHLGHHEHKHSAAGAADATPLVDAGLNGSAPDLDCTHCHGNCCALLHTAMPAQASAGTAHPGAAAPVATALLALTRPERPQWQPLA
jgi:hypothetical protein